jgi:imidazolonepropionase-like amidohydrolase
MDTVLTAGQVLPTPDVVLPQAAVLVRDDSIVAVGRRDEVLAAAAPDAVRWDFPDSTLMAGLFNAHVHLTFNAQPDFLTAFDAATPDELWDDAVHRLGALVRTGVTTVRDLGDRGGLAFRVRSSDVLPRVLAAGTPLTVPDGHCHFFGGAVRDDGEIRALIDANVEDGADVIKVMASGGQITAGGADMWDSQFDERQLRLIVDHAARHGVPVAAHAHGADAIEASVAAGVSTIEHCTWMTGPQRNDVRVEVVRRMAAEGIAACSTSSRNWRMLVEKMGDDLAGKVYGRLRTMEEHGVTLIAGTDAGLPGSVFDDPVGALELYEWLGFTRRRILEIATCDTARALGLGRVAGRLAPGYSADLIVVDGDPLESLAALSRLQFVMARGISPNL